MSVLENKPKPVESEMWSGLQKFMNCELPSLASFDFLNPLRIPTTDRAAERIIHELSNGAIPSNGSTQRQNEDTVTSSKISVDNGLNGSTLDAPDQGTDRSLRGILSTFSRLLKFSVSTSKPLALASFGLGCIAAMQGLAAGQLVSWVQSSGAPTIVGAGLMVAAGCTAITTICMTNWFSEQVNNRLGWKLNIFLDKRFHHGMLAQPFAKLDDEGFHRTVAEIQQHRFRLNHVLFGLSSGVAGGVGLGVSCYAYAQHYPLLAVATAAMILPRLVVDFSLAPSIDAREKEQAKRLKKIGSATKLLQETVAVREMKMHTREEWALKRVDALMEASRLGRSNIINDTAWRQLFGSAPLIVGGIMVTTTPIIGYLTQSFPGASLSAAVGAGIGLTTSAFMVAGLWGQIISQRIFIQRVLNFFDQGALPQKKSHPSIVSEQTLSVSRPRIPTPTIEFKDVEVRVRLREEPILTVKSLTLTPGEVVGIVGEKGQGKTTLLRLLMKQIEPTSGQILVRNFEDVDGKVHDEIDLAKISTAVWHKLVSKLYQDYPRLDGLSVSDASHLGSRADNDPGMLKARKIVDLTDILPKGLEPHQVRIGSTEDNGVTFSAGQMQSIAVLRALAFDEKPVLLLDEPGAHADPRSENDMLSRIKTASRDSGKLTVIVSHRYGTLTDVDRIIVIDKHTIADIGTHAELMRRCRVYREAWKIQIKALLPGFAVDINDDGKPVFTQE